MLPAYLLPSGALTAMRQTAQNFMTQYVEIYTTAISYDQFGAQIVTSGIVASGFSYFGAIKGSDRELLNETMQSYIQRDGVRVKTDALVLLPFGTELSNRYIIRKDNEDWHVVWNNNDTQDSVQVYSKAIVVQFQTGDEKLYG